MPSIVVLTTPQRMRDLIDRVAAEGTATRLATAELEVSRPVGPAPPGKGGPAHEVRFRFVFHVAPSAVLAEIERTAVDLLVVDNRVDPDRPYRSFAGSPAGRLMPLLASGRAASRGVSRRQVVLLASTGESLARDLYVAGAMKLGGYLVDPFLPGPAGRTESFLDQIGMMLGGRRPGKLALCLAGGGIEGLIYELGVLRAIDDFLVGRRLTEFDVFCGISAGAVIAAFLANGVPAHEVIAGMRDGTDSVDPIGKAILFRPNVEELLERVFGGIRSAWRRKRGGSALPGQADPLAALFRLVPGGFLSGEPIKWWLEAQLTRPGRTNCFTRLQRELYIGATDQDTGHHIVFGEAGRRDVPISHAVRASTALVPYYPPEPIGGRFLVDGAFTRTTNFGVAIRHGARFIILVNPFVPLVAERPGSVDEQGGVFAALQGVKALVHSRFEQTWSHLDEVYPDVDFQSFLPEGDELARLTGTLMKFFYRVEIAELAYEHTTAKIRKRMPGFADVMRRHGLLVRDPAEDAPVRLSERAVPDEPRPPEIAADVS